MVVCVKHFHVKCLGSKNSHQQEEEKEEVEEIEWRCAKCSMKCRSKKKLRRSVSAGGVVVGSDSGLLRVFDMNASPPKDFDDDDDVVAENVVNSQLDLAAKKMQDRLGNPFVGCTSTSSYPPTDMQTARLNLDIATQNAILVYSQALKDYISERRGVLGDGWHVKFDYSESFCKSFPNYCAPDGSRFKSMPEVAHYLGLSSGGDLTNENSNSVGLQQNGSHATPIDINDGSRSLSRVINAGNDVMGNANHGSESFLDGFPVQFENFFVTSIGKIDQRPPFHNTSQIWPIGYRSIWHDKLTGSLFIFNILDGGDRGPIFRVNRYPCTKQSIPNPSTVIYKPKCGPTDEISNCLMTQSAFSFQESQHLPSNNFKNGDLIGEFSVEGRSPSSAWKMALETLLLACHQAFQDIKVLEFFCNHSIESQHCSDSYNIDSLDRFGCLSGQVNSIPSLILNTEQLEVSCMTLRRWLQMDRFGLDAEFVQELIEKLPEVADCSEYKSLDVRCQSSIVHTVKSGFFSVLRKYHSQPMVSDSLTESGRRLGPPGNAVASNVPPSLMGNVLQAYEFCLRFYDVLGQEAPLSRQTLEYELLNPCVGGFNLLKTGSIKLHEGNNIEDLISSAAVHPDAAKESEGVGSQSLLTNFHMAMLKVIVEDILAKVVISEPSGAMESKARKGRKRNADMNMSHKKISIGLFPVTEITWPELARRYILASLSMDGNLEELDITSREFVEVFRCLNGDGGPLCGSLKGMAAIEADAMVLAEASKKVFSSVKSKVVDFIIDKNELKINNSSIESKRSASKCLDWIKVLEPIRKQPTNVGAKIRNQVKLSLGLSPPEWAAKMLLESISKEVYKGNAAGPTKKIVVEVLEKVRTENPQTQKKSKESHDVRTVSDVIMKRCRMVLRAVAAENTNKSIFGPMAESLLKPHEFDDVASTATVSRPLDFRIIDLRLDAGFYGYSHESFIEDVREVWQNLRMAYRNYPKYLDLIDSVSKNLENLYEQEVLTFISKTIEYTNSPSAFSDDLKNELYKMVADTIMNTLFVAPWEDRICKVCGKDENDHILLLCDRCDAEYHTYCLDPPLQRIPKSSWYCPPCIAFITSQPPKKKEIQREFTRNDLEALVDLADNMKSKEYWELGVQERTFLLQFLCDEALSSTLIRNHISADNCDRNRNYLGQDSAGRIYWVLGQPERLFVSGPHREDDVCVASGGSSSGESDSWNCYELDVEIEALVEWLRDDDARENMLKETIINWQRSKANDQNGQFDLQVNPSRSSVYCTNSRAALEKKFGSVLGAIRDYEGRILQQGKVYRCDCLELVESTRQHCFSCHSTFFSNEVHQCDGPLKLKDAVDTLGKQFTLTNGLVLSNENPLSVSKDSLQDNNNESSCEAGMSNTKSIGGKIPSTSRTLAGRAAEIFSCLKVILLDIEAALPREAFRPSRGDPDKLRGWRAFLKSAQSIYEMVQATIILEDMIKSEHLKRDWWYWSSPSAAAKISTVSSLALQIYALDAAIYYEKPPSPPPVDLTEPIVQEDSKAKRETPKKSNLKNNSKASNSTMVALFNDLEPSKISNSKIKRKKKKVEVMAPHDASICHEKPPPLWPVDPTEQLSKGEAPKLSNPKNHPKPNSSTMAGMSNDLEPFKISGSRDKPKKKKLKVSVLHDAGIFNEMMPRPPLVYPIEPEHLKPKGEAFKESIPQNNPKPSNSKMAVVPNDPEPSKFLSFKNKARKKKLEVSSD
uniref:methyl-CpG-binding domain-containing protein 9-like n=1 Tax=Erigeron canadensis TaxID=72917 RepID=UPI001CB8C188|nr:methyl-CpG-binding domain-containing protein 9-like [Erigeron canadensis]